MKNRIYIGFGGGCHWCTEAVFQALKGVYKVEQGFMASEEYNAFSEAVIVDFNPQVIPLKVLIAIHLRTHSSTNDHSFRSKYPSAIYTFNEQQHSDVLRLLDASRPDFDKPLVTQVLRFKTFKASDEHFQNYYQKDPKKPFCKTFIDPKLQMLKREYSKYAF